MALTADFIRSLAGLSAAELPDSTITSLHVIEVAEAASANYPSLTDLDKLYYEGYKAIVALETYILNSTPETIRDNFNQFTRFDNLREVIDIAKAKVAEVELADAEAYDLLSIVPPDIDPVTNEGR